MLHSFKVYCKAMDYAEKAHGSQMYGDKPYTHHLVAVAARCIPYIDEYPDILAIAALHDVVEDCMDISIADIALEFGNDIADAVAFLTDQPGKNRKERKAATNAMLASIQVNEKYVVALIVKAADRYANVRESVITGNQSKFDMYVREHRAFREAVYRPNLCEDIWTCLNFYIAEGITSNG